MFKKLPNLKLARLVFRIPKRTMATTLSQNTIYHADHKAPVVMLSFGKEFFEQLTTKEKLYTYYMSKASHCGTRIVLRQVSHESESIFDLIMHIHKTLITTDGAKTYTDFVGDSSEAQSYLEYASQFLSNLGNYKSFGDRKFIPGCSIDTWYKLMDAAQININDKPNVSLGGYPFDTYKDLLHKGVYNVTDKVALLGFPSEGHISSYYLGKAVSAEDMNLLKREVFGKYGILPENTRINKINENFFEILVASYDKDNNIDYYPSGEFTLDDNVTKCVFKFGDHSREMGMICRYLNLAKEYAANNNQVKMLDEYIKHFKTGSSRAHKNSQKIWVKDLSPIIETNIGFIETYREPSGIIGEFESFVAIQNKERTKKFAALVSSGEKYISLLPWDKDYEKPKFQAPDFTSLEVVTFTGSGIPAGINIPNYDDVRLNIGFKNVSLGNILNISCKIKQDPTFISRENFEIFKKYQGLSFEVQVGIHELLGHGSGKLLSEVEDGKKFNFDFKSPPLGVDNKTPVSTYYKVGETWGSKFGALAGAFEECRAEVIAMYLLTNRELLRIFGFNDKQEQDDIIYVGYLQMARAGLMALEYWDPQTKKWGQPHMQARFSIMKTFLEHCSNPDFCRIVVDDGTMHIELDRSLIESSGHECIEDYLRHLHIYKCSGDVVNGSKYFIDRSSVPENLAKLREIVLKEKLPRRQIIQANIVLDGDGTNDSAIKVVNYEETPVGMIQSFIEREL
ncbi:dipeptidyl-peptidase III SCDLUD_005140 [Saccharomycodes ludwigii]|uniref:dipeptidyl-peptidase III n=1 Tax=Saccharomycodes ludwigii TaxID=36035 RepID=UPI001E84C79F|nr:hypothetical protein SCDLUD_005140 [Saccharomycodes ludwigii]KAH3898802.1 hypothetical protein SCDLUD_005140 [Saccharomycodes ludwigii]